MLVILAVAQGRTWATHKTSRALRNRTRRSRCIPRQLLRAMPPLMSVVQQPCREECTTANDEYERRVRVQGHRNRVGRHRPARGGVAEVG